MVIQNNMDPENDEDIQQEGIFVPWKKAFINSYAAPFQKFFMTKPVDQGDKHQKVLVDYSERKSIGQSGGLL